MKQKLVTTQLVKTELKLKSLQGHLHKMKYKEWLLLAGFTGGAALLRVPMQVAPSIEPISFFAFLSGWLFGKKKGFLVGASALYLSNFLTVGGQGPWTFFMLAGFGIIGAAGGFLRKNASIIETVLVMGSATLIYEIIVNLGSIMFFPFAIIPLLLGAIPFGIVHLLSNAGFSALLPISRKLIVKKGFNERQLAERIMKKLKLPLKKRNI
ncbi:MAG: DUF6580 family putative transport protein [Nanoarchaeota archaeon]